MQRTGYPTGSVKSLIFSLPRPPPSREDTATPLASDKTSSSVTQTPVEAEFPQLPEGLEKKPIVLKFSAMMDGITIGAALLPSLKAEYKMGRMRSHGMTGEPIRAQYIPLLTANQNTVHSASSQPIRTQ